MKGVTQGAVGGPTTRMVVRGKVTRHRIQRNWGFRGGGRGSEGTRLTFQPQMMWDTEKNSFPWGGDREVVCGGTARYPLGQEVQKRCWGNGTLGMTGPESPVLRWGCWIPMKKCTSPTPLLPLVPQQQSGVMVTC